MLTIERESCSVFVGKNARDNWDLLSRSEPYDIFLHVLDFPSGYVIVAPKKNVDLTKEDLAYACNLCKKQSCRAKHAPGTTKVLCTEVRHVSKGRCVGEVIIQPHNMSTLTI